MQICSTSVYPVARGTESGDRQYVYESLYQQDKEHPNGTAFSEADFHTRAETGNPSETVSEFDTAGKNQESGRAKCQEIKIVYHFVGKISI